MKIKPIAWSYSRLSVYRECPKKFKYKFIDRLPEPPSPPMARGLAVHQMLERYVRNNVLAKGISPKLPKEFQHLKGHLEVLRSSEPLCELELAFNRKWGRVEWMAHDVWVRVKIDVVHELDGGADRATLDYKTGRIRPEAHAESLKLYALATILALPKLKQLTTGVWYVDEEKTPRPLARYEKLASSVKELQSYWEKEAAALGRERRYAATPGSACRWCAYSCRKLDEQGRQGPCADSA